MLQDFSVNVYSFLDQGYTLSFIIPLAARKFYVLPNVLIEPFLGCTPMGGKWGNSTPRGQIFSCLKACKMMAKGTIYHLVRVKESF